MATKPSQRNKSTLRKENYQQKPSSTTGAESTPSSGRSSKCGRCAQSILECDHSGEEDDYRSYNMEEWCRLESECLPLARIIGAIQFCPKEKLNELLAVLRSDSTIEDVDLYIRENMEGVQLHQKRLSEEGG